jgi:ABC-type transport system involved in cytochrome bd biosynthesis fused ATPase/permease subunit
LVGSTPAKCSSSGQQSSRIALQHKPVQQASPAAQQHSPAGKSSRQVQQANPSGKSSSPAGKSSSPRKLSSRQVQQNRPATQVQQASLRRAISIEPQEPILFHLSLADNIDYAHPNAPMEAIIQAAQRAYAHDFIEALPEGYQTLVGERGVKLSG